MVLGVDLFGLGREERLDVGVADLVHHDEGDYPDGDSDHGHKEEVYPMIDLNNDRCTANL